MDTNPTEGSMGWYIIEILLFCLLMLLLVGLLAFILFVLLFRKSAFVSGLFKKTMPYYAVLVNVVLALYMLLLLALHRFVELSVWLLFLSQPIVSSFKFFEAPFCFFGHEWTGDNTCLNCNAVRENVS